MEFQFYKNNFTQTKYHKTRDGTTQAHEDDDDVGLLFFVKYSSRYILDLSRYFKQASSFNHRPKVKGQAWLLHAANKRNPPFITKNTGLGKNSILNFVYLFP